MILQTLSILLDCAIRAESFSILKWATLTTNARWNLLTMNLLKIKTWSKWLWLMMMKQQFAHAKFATLQSSMVQVSWSTTSSLIWRNVTFVAARLPGDPTILPQNATNWSCKTSLRGRKRLLPSNSWSQEGLQQWSWVEAMEETSCRWLLDHKVVLLSVNCVHALLA